MYDTITIKDLEVYAHHGVYPEEKKLGQKFLVTAELYTDFSNATENDDINMSLDYGEISHKITEFAQNNTYKLIETLAEKLAQMLLETYVLLNGVQIEIKKPWAPIGLPLEYPSVKLKRFWHTAYIAFGSNMGDKEQYINTAIKTLKASKGCIVEKVSDIISTKPYGGVEQEDFLNGVLCLKTYLSPNNLLKLLNKIEKDANRVREIHWGPRTLDLDIILYDNEVIDTEDLHIPHIDMQNRDFVLEPLSQIAPYVRHPILNKTVYQLLCDLKGDK